LGIHLQGHRRNTPPAHLLGIAAACEESLEDLARTPVRRRWTAAAVELALPQTEVHRWVRLAIMHGIATPEVHAAAIHRDSAIRTTPIAWGWAHVLILHPLATGAARQEQPFLFVRRARTDKTPLPGELRRFFAALDAAVAVPLRQEWAAQLWQATRRCPPETALDCLAEGSLDGTIITGSTRLWADIVCRLLKNNRISGKGSAQ
jgi:hypothetical protein